MSTSKAELSRTFIGLDKLVPDQSKIVDTLVKQYNDFAKGSCENIIGLAKTIYLVERELNQRYREQFYAEVRLDPNGSTARKLKKIGEESPRFDPYLDKLPNAWTTLYALAAMESHEFKLVVEAGVLSPFVSLKEIQQVVPRSGGNAKSQLRVSMDLSEVGEFNRRCEFAKKLRDLAEEYHVKLVNEELTNLIKGIDSDDLDEAE